MKRQIVYVKVYILLLISLFSLSACQIRLLPEFPEVKKFSTNFSPLPLERKCGNITEKRLYVSDVLVSDPFQGKRVLFENEKGELKFLKTVEWGARFADLVNRSFEGGLREAFASYPEVKILSSESAAASDFDIGLRIERHILGAELPENGTGIKEKSVIKTKALLRLYNVKKQIEDYVVIEHATILPLNAVEFDSNTASKEIVDALRGNIEHVSKRSYEHIEQVLCSSTAIIETSGSNE